MMMMIATMLTKTTRTEMMRKDRFADNVDSPGAVAPHRKAQLFSHFRTERLNTIVK